MEEWIILLNMTFLLLVAGICSVIFKKLRMPVIIGYLVAGIILANYWANESTETEDIVTFLADLGLVLLMFCIGMELNLKKLKKMGSFALLVVLIQVPMMITGGYLFSILLGWSAIQAIFFGAIISGSSTAVVTAILRDQRKLDRDEANTIILITVIEDVAQVLILSMASPLLVGETMSLGSMAVMLATVIVFIVVCTVIGLLFLPRILDWIGNKMPEEVLLITSLGMCFALALLSVWIGMSMAIGAFLMGVIVSQSTMRRRIEHDVTPMKNIFMAMFFISIGLEIAPSGMIDNIFLIFAIFAVYALLKFGSVLVAYFIGNKPIRQSFMSALSLVAMGEFAFIIAKEALDAGVVSEDFYTAVIGAALVSMIALPLMTKNSDKVYDTLETKTPASIKSRIVSLVATRDMYYSKMALASKSTAEKFRKRATVAYIFLLVTAIVEILFVIYTQDLTDYIYNSVDGFSYPVCYTLVLFFNFLMLFYPLYKVVKNLKFLDRVFVDNERKAAESEGNSKLKSLKLHHRFIEANIWTLILILDFIILLIVPSKVGFWEHVLVLLGGIAVILAVYYIRLWNEKRPVV